MDSKEITIIKELFLKIENTTEENISHINYNLNDLMILEKEKLGYKKTDIVFISAGDFSRFYWCQMQTFYSIKEHELDKFFGYLRDKIEYSIKLNKVKKIPKNENELLKIGDDLNLNNIFELLKLEEYQNNITQEEINIAKEELIKCNTPSQKGHFLETIHGKKLPQIHFYIEFEKFIFTCMPDGITETQVYEFKSSKNKYFAEHTTNKAKLQADIYGICFNKKEKIIEQLIINEDRIEEFKEPININLVKYIIQEFKKIINNKLPKPPKEEFKCRGCEYRNICTIKYK